MDLTTTYLGLELRSPLVVGAAAALSEDIDNIKRMEDAGASAVVLHSLFEEQIEQEQLELHHHLSQGTHSFAESLTYFPELEVFHVGPELYLNHIRKAKDSVGIPIIASINGATPGGWVEYAQSIQQAGADALELNIYDVVTDPDVTSADIEEQYLEVVREVRAEVTIPFAVKLSPYFTSLPNIAKQLTLSGANGLVLFNRFYQPDIDLDDLEVRPNVQLSSPSDSRLPMRWIAILYGQTTADLAATGGIQRGTDVVRMMMAGAKVTMVVSALLRHGIGHLAEIDRELRHWMTENDYRSIRQMQGTMSQLNCPNPHEFERAQYMKAVQTYLPQWTGV